MSNMNAWPIAFSGIGVLPNALGLRMAREMQMAAAVDEFYHQIRALLNDPEMPESAENFLDDLDYQMTNRSAARPLFFALLSGRFSLRGATEINSVMSYYLNERKELANCFLGACVAAIFAISYRSRFFGFMLRRLVLFHLYWSDDRAFDIVACLRAIDAEVHSAAVGNEVHCAVAT
jgi:hypothetical protein